ncbi:MAG: PAS domain S-box protein [Candidatus Obscuribacterales bacterium]|nr:PAS domain S-box protein [Candidatus Obscuribacterales bacterium]
MSEKPKQKSKITLTLAQKGLVLVGVPLLFELIFVGMLATLLSHSESEALRVAQSRAIITKTNTLTKLIIEAGAALAGYSANRAKSYLEHYEAAVEQIPVEMEELRSLSADSPEQEERLEKIESSVEADLSMIKNIKREIDAGRNDQDPFKTLQKFTDSLEQELDSFVRAERQIEKSSPQIQQRSKQMLNTLLWSGTALNVLLSLLMANLFYTGITGRLKILTDNTIRLARNESLNPPIAGSDEVAQLDRVFHEMAGALVEAARKEHSIIENALDVICSIDENGKFTAVSPASVQVFGYQPEELIGRRFTELILAEDIESTLDCTRRIMLEQALLPFENRVVKKDGTLVNVLWSSYWSNQELCMFCVAHDISDRKRAENMLKESELRTRSIIESMPIGLVITSPIGEIELVNPQMEKIFDMTKEELLGQHLSELFPGNEEFSPENFKAGAYQRLLARVREFKAQRKGGEIFPAELTVIVFNTSEGSRLLINILDVTERHSMERLKREFVSTVSHELRTPLTAIRGSLTLLSIGALGEMAEQAMKAVKIAERNALRLVNLINDLLDIEKLEAGKMEMVFEQVQISTVFERAFETVRPYAEQFDIKLELQMPEDLLLSADCDRLVQVMINLLSNACKYSPKHDTVTVSSSKEENQLFVSIVDHGRGIPAETLPKIFERFQQVESADSKRKGGTGLGLAICKAIIEQHNGSIGASSEYGKGSKFWFRLPLWNSPEAPEAAEKLARLELPPEFRKLQEEIQPGSSIETASQSE